MITLTKGLLSVTLRNPDFGDTDSIEMRRVQRKSRGGDLVTYRDPIWPKTETFTYEFTYLSRVELLRLQNFIIETLGQIVTLTDYNGQTHNGIITAPSEEFSQPGRENHSAKFTFEVQL